MDADNFVYVPGERFSSLIYSARGYDYMLLKQYPAGIDDLTKAIALRPDYKLNYINRAKAYQICGKMALYEADMRSANALTDQH